MCCLFGLIDPQQRLTGNQKSRIMHTLAIAAEARGTDATGVAYTAGGRIVIHKAPVAGRRLRFSLRDDTVTAMGHTRMATQGSAKLGRNNHPFCGHLEDGRAFALAHNGVLYNDADLRRTLRLPKPRIETDSFVAVQLLQTRKALDFNSLKYMAEKVEGSFTFTVLDEQNALYIIKGDSPFYLLWWPSLGLYLYASTEQIMLTALKGIGLSLRGAVKIALVSGEIIRIDHDGSITRATFDDSGIYSCFAPYSFGLGCGCRTAKRSDRTYMKWQ